MLYLFSRNRFNETIENESTMPPEMSGVSKVMGSLSASRYSSVTYFNTMSFRSSMVFLLSVYCTSIVLEGRGVADLLAPLAGMEDAAHDLPAPGLGQGVDELDLLGHGQRRQLLPDEVHDLEVEILAGREARLQGDEGFDDLEVDGVRLADDGRFGDRRVFEQGGFDLERADQVAGRVDDVVVAPGEPVVSVLV